MTKAYQCCLLFQTVKMCKGSVAPHICKITSMVKRMIRIIVNECRGDNRCHDHNKCHDRDSLE